MDWPELNWTACALRNTYVVNFVRYSCVRLRCASKTRTRVNSGEEFKDLFTFSPPVYCAPQHDLYTYKNHMKNPHGKCVAVLLAGRWWEQRISANEKDLSSSFVAMRDWDFLYFVFKEILYYFLLKFCFFLVISAGQCRHWLEAFITRTTSDSGICEWCKSALGLPLSLFARNRRHQTSGHEWK